MKTAPAVLSLFSFVLLAASPTVSAAADLSETITPGPRPYPYEILGAKPGMTPDEAKKAIETGRDYTLNDVREQMQFSFSTGATFTYEAVTMMKTDLSPALYRENKPAFNDVSIGLASPVMGGRVNSISRTIRDKPQDMPDGKTLLSQLEEKYGKPSLVSATEYETRIVYTWTTDGFVSEIKGGQEIKLKLQTSPNSYTIRQYSPCGVYPGSSSASDLLKDYPNAPDLNDLPRCVAVFAATVKPTPSYTTVAMYLTDYSLARQSEKETTRQVMQILSAGSGGKKLGEL